MLESKITAKGQTTLPKAVREFLSISAGDRVRYVIDDGAVRILPARPIDRLFGALCYRGPAATLQDMDRVIAEGASET